MEIELNIGLSFEDTLTDSNYSLIDIINMDRERIDFIDYNEFDSSGYHSIWDYPLLTDEELDKKDFYLFKSFDELDLVILAKKVLTELKDKGYKFQLYTSYDEKFRNKIEDFLYEKGLFFLVEDMEFNIKENNVNDIIKRNNLDIYIEDNPYIIKECNKLKPVIIVRSHNYNQTCYNLMRLDCYSQLTSLIKRSEKRIELNNKKLIEEAKKDELRELREAVREKR